MPPLPQQPVPSQQPDPPGVLGGPQAAAASFEKHKDELTLPPPQVSRPATDPHVGADPLRGILDPIQVDNGIKRQAWDAYHQAQSPEDFRKFFDSAQLPQEAKRALWNLKFQPPIDNAPAAQQAIAQEQAQPRESFFVDRIIKGLTAPGTLLGGPTAQETQGQQDLTKGVQESQAWYAQHPEAQQANQGFFPPKGGLQMPPDAAAPHMQAYWKNPTAANLQGLPTEKAFSPMAAGMVKPGTLSGGLAEGLAGMASPANIAQLAAIPVNELINLAYTGVMGKDTVQLLVQAKQLEASGDHKGASELYGHAIVAGGMTLLTALGLRPGKTSAARPGASETAAQPGVTPSPEQARVPQVAPTQAPNLAQEGGPRPITSPGISGGREIGGDQPRAAVSAPIEGAKGTTGTVTPRPTGREGLPDQRVTAGQPPAGMPERRTQALMDYQKAVQTTPPGQPTPGEQLSKDIRTARAGAPSGLTEGQVLQEIMRDPADYQLYKDADEKTRAKMLVQTKREMESQNVQRPSGVAQTPAPAAAQPAAQPLPTVGSVKKPTYTTGQPLRPLEGSVQEPVRPSAVTPTQKPKPYVPLPPEQRPRVSAGGPDVAPTTVPTSSRPIPAPTPAPEAPASAVEPRKLEPGTPRPTAASPEQLEAWKATRRQEATARSVEMARTPPPKAANAKEAAATLDRTLTRHLKTQATGGRMNELTEAIMREQDKGPEATKAASEAMQQRADKADGMRKTVEHLLSKPTQDWDKEMREVLHAGALRTEEDPITGKQVPAKGFWLTKEGVQGGRRAKGDFQRAADAVTAEIYNNLRGNQMKEVGLERRPQLDEPTQQKLEELQKSYQDLLGTVRAQEGHRPTDEQLVKLKDLMSGIHALRGSRMVAETGPGSEPVGTAATGKFWNELMGRPKGAHFGRPSPEMLKARLQELREESQMARSVAQQLRGDEPVTAGNAELAQAEHEEKEASKRTEAPKAGVSKEEEFISKAEKRTDEELGKWWRTPGREYQSLDLTKRLQNASPELKARWNAVTERAQRMFEEIGIREGSIPKPKEPAKAPEKAVEAPKEARRPPTPEEYTAGLKKEYGTARMPVPAKGSIEMPPARTEAPKPVAEAPKAPEPTKAPAVEQTAKKGYSTGQAPEAYKESEAIAPAKAPAPKTTEPKAKGAGMVTKTSITRDQLSDVAERIRKLPEGEDRSSLSQRLNRVSEKFEELTNKMKMSLRNIEAMRKAGETERTYTNKEGRTVTENLGELEARVRNLGLERSRLVEEQVPSLRDTVGAFEKAPLPKAPAETPTQTKQVAMPTYSAPEVVRDPITGKYEGTIPAEKIGERMVTPSPAPKEEGLQTRLDELKNQEQHLANMQQKFPDPNRGQAIAMSRLKKSINAIRASLGKDAPPTAQRVGSTLYGTELLNRAKRAEPAPPKEVVTIQPTEGRYSTGGPRGTSGDDLMDYLEAKGEGIPRAILQATRRLHDATLEEGRDFIASPIMEHLKSKALDEDRAAARYARALDIYNRGIKAKDVRALGNALDVARTGKIRDARESEAGFVSARGRSRVTAATAWDSLQNKFKTSWDADRDAKRIEQEFWRLGSSTRNEMAVLAKKLRSLPEDVVRRKVFDYREQQLLPPESRTLELTPREQAHNEEMTELAREQTRIIKKMSQAGFDTGDIAALTHRVPTGKGQLLEQVISGKSKFWTNPLSTFASARKRTHYQAMIDPEGHRSIVHESRSGKIWEWHGGVEAPEHSGQRQELEQAGYSFARATSREIEEGTGQGYLRDTMGHVLSWYQLRSAERAYDMMEWLKASPQFERLATRDAAVAREKGWRYNKAGPQFDGYYFEPHMSEVMKRYWTRVREGEAPDGYTRFSEFVKSTIFRLNPFLHLPNIGQHVVGEKGFVQALNPANWPVRKRAMARAIDTMMNPDSADARAMMEAGAPLFSGPDNHDITHLIQAKFMQEITETRRGDELARALGLNDRRELARRVWNVGKEVTWGSHDLGILSSTYERMERKGESLEDALDHVQRHIPNYRVPTRIMNSRTLGRLFNTPGLTIFTNYHYGALKSYFYSIREIMPEKLGGLNKADRADGLDRLLYLGLMTFMVHPLMDQFAKYMTQDDKAYVRRAGGSTFIYNTAAWARGLLYGKGARPTSTFPTGSMGTIPYVESILTPAPVVGALQDAIQGGKLMRKGVGLKDQAQEVKRILGRMGGASAISMAEDRLPSGGERFNWKKFLWQMAGVRFQTPPKAGARLGGLKKLSK